MATVTLTSRFNDLNDWPGNLFNGREESGTLITSRTATQMLITLGPGAGDFGGYKVIVTGTGFSYLGGIAVAGTMSQVRVTDAGGNTVITFGNLGANAIASDLSQFYHNMFGSPDPNAGPDGDGKLVWSHLMAGNDVITGTTGNDGRIFTGLEAGNDIYNLLGGDDHAWDGMGADTYHGGDGFDVLTWGDTTWFEGASATRGVAINVNAGVALDVWGSANRFTGFEEFVGSRFNDVFVGHTTTRDFFAGLRGRDVINGGDITFRDGVQTVDDRDRANYSDDYWQGGTFGIVANLETSFLNGSIRGAVRDGFGNFDTVIDIENVEGTRYNDVFLGSRVDNSFWGGQGRDSFVGNAGQDEIIFERGFNGQDPTQGVVINLGLATGQIINDGFGNTENASGIEWIVGTRNGDRIVLNALNNEVQLLDGADTVAGAGGRDTFVFNGQEDLGDADRITDFSATGAGADVLAFEVNDFSGMTTTLRLVNGLNATTTFGTFLFNAATDTLTWDSNGTLAGGRSTVAVLTNVNALSASNFELWD